jgi:hypothetical protein
LQFARSVSIFPGPNLRILIFLTSAVANVGHLSAAARRMTESALNFGRRMSVTMAGTFDAVTLEHMSQNLLKNARLTISVIPFERLSKLGTEKRSRMRRMNINS